MITNSEELKKEIALVALSINDNDGFSFDAKNAAAKMGIQHLWEMKQYFHRGLDDLEPPHFKQSEWVNGRILGAWMDATQYAIFEIAYFFKDKALIPLLDFLNETAFGEYDWTQYKALLVLLRLANEGIETENIFERFAIEVPKIRIEVLEIVLPYIATAEVRISQSNFILLKNNLSEYFEEDELEVLQKIKTV